MGIRIYLAGRVALEVAGEMTIEERQFRGRHDLPSLTWSANGPVPFPGKSWLR